MLTREHLGQIFDKLEANPSDQAAIADFQRVGPAFGAPDFHQVGLAGIRSWASQSIGAPVDKPNPHIEVGETREALRPFNSFGEQMQVIARSMSPGGQTDVRLLKRSEGLNENISSEGGFLLQQDFAKGLLDNGFQSSEIAKRCKKIKIGKNSNSVKLNGFDETSRTDGSRFGGVRSYWLEEGGEKLASKPKFRQIELSLKKLIGLCYTTDELLQDAAVLDSVLRAAFSDEIAFRVDDAIVSGDGIGRPLGVMNCGSLVTVDKEAGQVANTFNYENVLKLWCRLIASSRKNACWYLSQTVEQQLYGLSLAVGTGGGPVYLPAGGASSAPFATLFGRPVVPIEQCSALGTVGDVILGDFSKYLLADKGGIATDISMHVRFVFDENCYRFVYRCDGQPMLQNSISPFKGSDSQSHFVALATRA